MSRGFSNTASQRQLRVGEEVRHALAWIVERGELRDPVLAERAVTVTEVRMSPDLKHAIAFVVPLGGADADTVLAGLNRARGFVRHRVAEMVRLKFMPDFLFCIDRSFEQAEHIATLLRDPRVARDLEHTDTADTGGDAETQNGRTAD